MLRKPLRPSCFALLAGLLLSTGARAETKPELERFQSNPPPRIQMAILLDTSGSMEGLINQARTQIWKIVNELATCKRDGRVPDMQVALFEYGKSSLPQSQNYLRTIVPLTDDLDKISQELFALRTNGGDEYCGAVIEAALTKLEWSNVGDDLKLIFVAGNEPFTQGGVDYKQACRAAVARGITVNTIYCGPEAEGVRTQWQHGAQLADGSFMNIDQNRQVATISTPFDRELAQLSTEINSTYFAYGNKKVRLQSLKRQQEADKQASAAAPAAAAERAGFKGSGRYRTSALDLLDAVRDGKVKLDELKHEELPEELRKLNRKQREEFLKKKAKQRTEIQEKIQALGEQRKQYIAAERKKQSQLQESDSFDQALIRVIREQAGRKKFQFAEPSTN